VLLAALTLLTVIVKWSAGTSLVVDLVLCGLAGLWMLGVFTVRPAWRDRPPVMVLFFTVLIAIVAVLVFRDPWFGFFTPACYFYAFRLLRWPWLLPGVAVVAAVAGTAQAYNLDRSTTSGIVGYVAVLAVNVLPMCGYAWYAWRGATRNDEREQALREVSEANRKLAATLAENATLQQRLLTQARETGVLDERARMAREIHDTLAQGLTGIITQLQAAERDGQSAAERRRHFDLAIQLARDSLTEARRSVRAMQPEPLESARLPEALAGVAEKFTTIHGVAATVTTTGEPRRIRPDAEITLLRAAQEAMVNVARHARAGKVGLTLSYMEDQVNLDIRDDGVGFDPQPAGAMVPARAGGGGYGLLAMRQRVEGVAGTLEVESAPGGGTAVSASVPTDGGW
jgi:signal transduction histidine kinase